MQALTPVVVVVATLGLGSEEYFLPESPPTLVELSGDLGECRLSLGSEPLVSKAPSWWQVAAKRVLACEVIPLIVHLEFASLG